MEKFISGKLLTIKRNFKANRANSGKKGDYFYTLKYNNKQIQFRRHSNLDRSRFLFKNFYIDFMEDVYSLYLNKRKFRSKKKRVKIEIETIRISSRTNKKTMIIPTLF